MGAVIPPEKKKRLLPFIQSNFGKISEREIARRIGVGKTTVNRWRKESGLKLIRHKVNENFFSKWSANMSYILGYIFADGNIAWNPKKSYRALTITISSKDKTHLENIRNNLKSTRPLLYSSSTKSYRLIINNKKICLDLMKHGLYPQKSLSVEFPKVPKKFIKDFIRGIIDADGNVRYVNRKRSPYFEITIASGSRNFCQGIVKSISNALGINVKIRKVKNNLFIIQYTCQKGLRLANWIYSDLKLCMRRKFQQYKMALDAKGGGQP